MIRLVFFMLIAISRLAWAQADELDEVAGLPEETTPLEVSSIPTWTDAWHQRSYLWLESYQRKQARAAWQSLQGPVGEASLTLDYKSSLAWQAFADGRLLRDENTFLNYGILEQGGLRWQVQNRLLLVIGKERSRKAPGLIIAPSDFLYAQENLPGQREQRAGLWQARVSYQETAQTYDLIVLPYRVSNEHGLPETEARWNAWAWRGFRQFANFDLQVAIGRLADGRHLGLSSQGIVGVWKLYLDTGWTEHAKTALGADRAVYSAVAGIEYQGWSKWSMRLETLQQGQGASREDLHRLWQRQQIFGRAAELTQSLQPFLRRSYSIVSGNGMSLLDRINVFANWIASLEESAWLLNTRAEYILSDRQVLGFSMLGISEGDQQQYASRQLDRQLSFDWKLSL